MYKDQYTLMFLPDISGFTEFVNNTEITHSQHIISELLEIIIDSVTLDLQVSEIEGDAVLFYSNRELPDMEKLIAQVQTTFIKFHTHLKLYESRRICPCGACCSAVNLSLKFIIHAGNTGFTKIQDKLKPFGASVILIHRLLKNKVDLKEYALFTDVFNDDFENEALIKKFPWITHNNGHEKYDHLERIETHYFSLDPLLADIPIPPTMPLPNITRHPIKFKLKVNQPVEVVYEGLSNFDLRLHWNKIAKQLIYEKKRVNRIGTIHRCILKNDKQVDLETFTESLQGEDQDTIIFGEKLLDFPFLKSITHYYVLKPAGRETIIKCQIHFHPKYLISSLLIPVIKIIYKSMQEENMQLFKSFCENN